jgi:hypothetical protein
MKALKTAAKGLVLGASIFALAGVANAVTPVDFNLYGASAQFNFFTNAAPAFLTGQLGCASANATPLLAAGDANSALTIGTNCSSVGGANINFRYSSKASFDGIEAVQGIQDPNAVTICSDKSQRPMATLSSDGVTMLPTTSTASCQTVTVGTSDVQASSFLQQSQGALLGPLGGAATTLSFNGVPATGLSVDAPLAYPFAFYVNPGVTSTRCSDTAHFDNLCLTDADCGAVSGSCKSSTIDNISRLQAVLLFSGQILYWSDFGTANGATGGYYTTKPVTLCMRHAGSGTLATLDLGIVRGNGWGNGLVQFESDPAGGSTNPNNLPYVWFNNATGDMKNCLTWAAGNLTGVTPMATLDPNGVGGAIGFMDADNANTASYVQIKYNGFAANRINMRDGMYDDFYAVNHMYRNTGNLNSSQTAIYNTLIGYISNPANINPSTVGAGKSLTYGAATELRVSKQAGGDATYPEVVAGGPADPMVP